MIMEKIKKGYNLKVISITISIILLFTNALYPAQFSKKTLRLEIGTGDDTYLRINEAECKKVASQITAELQISNYLQAAGIMSNIIKGEPKKQKEIFLNVLFSALLEPENRQLKDKMFEFVLFLDREEQYKPLLGDYLVQSYIFAYLILANTGSEYISLSSLQKDIFGLLNTGWTLKDMNTFMHILWKRGLQGSSAIPNMFKLSVEHIRFEKVVEELEASSIGTTVILEREPTISQLVFSLMPIDFEIAVYEAHGAWKGVRGDKKSVGLRENWQMQDKNLALLVHNHPGGFTLPSSADLMCFSRGGIGLIIGGYEQHYTVTIFETPQINPETQRAFASDDEMREFFERKEKEFGTMFGQTLSIQGMSADIENYLGGIGVKFLALTKISNEDESLSITDFVRKYQPRLKTLQDQLNDFSAKSLDSCL